MSWLLLLDGARILLEKRPAPGIWGGLWSFPEAPARDIAGYCRRTLACELRSRQVLQTLEHGFTHLRLRIRPFLCHVTRGPGVETPRLRWMELAEAPGAALPAPVAKLIEHMKQEPALRAGSSAARGS